MLTGFGGEPPPPQKKRYHLEDLELEGKIKLKLILNKQDWRHLTLVSDK